MLRTYTFVTTGKVNSKCFRLIFLPPLRGLILFVISFVGFGSLTILFSYFLKIKNELINLIWYRII